MVIHLKEEFYLLKIIKMNIEKEIVSLLNNKASVKQEVYQITKDFFSHLQEILKNKTNSLNSHIVNKKVKISYEQSGKFDAKLKFSGDTLLFHMHTNVFDFSSTHQIHKTKYVKEDNLRSFCGVINIYNFLSDSLKYNRFNDTGFLIARIFINKDSNYFVEGDKELGFLFKNFTKQQLDKKKLNDIINASMQYSLNFDLLAPDFKDLRTISVHQILDQNNTHKIKTSKRMGYKLSHETNNW